jgi:hypothetical protein
MDGEKEAEALGHVEGAERSDGKAVMLSPQTETDALSKGEAERNAVFNNLVREDADIVGLVAYSIYKQNKVDWLSAFEKALGRAPSSAELTAYILGESTPRRLAIYRQLAAATLNGNGPEAGSETSWQSGLLSSSTSQAKPAQSWLLSSVVSYAVLAAAILLGIWIVARYALPAHG